MATKHLVLLAILVISFIGCSDDCPVPPEPETITTIKYEKYPIPKIPEKPVAEEYDVYEVSFDKEDYYLIPRVHGSIMGNNYLMYKDWAESMYSILKDIEESNKKSK